MKGIKKIIHNTYRLVGLLLSLPSFALGIFAGWVVAPLVVGLIIGYKSNIFARQLTLAAVASYTLSFKKRAAAEKKGAPTDGRS